MGARVSRLMRASPKFISELEDIKLKRIKLGKDKPLKPVKCSRLTLAMTRHPLFSKIKNDIIINDLNGK